MGLFGRLPGEGEEVEADPSTRLRVERTRGRRILAVRVNRVDVPEGMEAEAEESERNAVS